MKNSAQPSQRMVPLTKTRPVKAVLSIPRTLKKMGEPVVLLQQRHMLSSLFPRTRISESVGVLKSFRVFGEFEKNRTSPAIVEVTLYYSVNASLLKRAVCCHIQYGAVNQKNSCERVPCAPRFYVLLCQSCWFSTAISRFR